MHEIAKHEIAKHEIAKHEIGPVHCPNSTYNLSNKRSMNKKIMSI